MTKQQKQAPVGGSLNMDGSISFGAPPKPKKSSSKPRVRKTKACRGYPAYDLPPHSRVPLDRFGSRKGSPDGLEAICKDCAKKGRIQQKAKRDAKRAEAK